MNTHPSYPARCDINDIEYEKECPFYEDKILDKFVGIWADSKNVSEEELKERLSWENNKLVPLKSLNYKFINGKPINKTRTGIKGRGLLGRYGPNHAADTIVTRINWFKLCIEFIGGIRKDTDNLTWCIPGGMVDPGESVSLTIKREFKEEVASENSDDLLNEVFKNGKILYAGETNGDPRTTDNAWIETYVVHYHLTNKIANKIKLTPQEGEIKNVKWISCDINNMYGDHKKFIKLAKKNVIIMKLRKLGINLLILSIVFGLVFYN